MGDVEQDDHSAEAREPIGYASLTRPPEPPVQRGQWAIWLGVGIAMILGAMLLLPSPGQAREPANRMECASNLRHIGRAIQMYANEFGGSFPPSVDLLVIHEDITSEVFVCPSSNDERATGPTSQAVAAAVVTNPIHCSYVYTGAGLTLTAATPQHVVAYEHAGNHNRAGMNVLYGDGSVAWLDARAAAHAVAELTAGRNPPRPYAPK